MSEWHAWHNVERFNNPWLQCCSMAQNANADDSEQTAKVSEDKFNGTATLNVTVPDGTDKDTVKAYARKYFRDTHGTDPSKIIAEKDATMSSFSDEDSWDVMVSDHSSGSLVDGAEYEI